MYNIHDSTVYLYFFIILANKVACLLTGEFLVKMAYNHVWFQKKATVAFIE